MNRHDDDWYGARGRGLDGASRACEEVTDALRVLVAGCRYFVDSCRPVLDGYRGIAAADTADCGIALDDVEGHLEESRLHAGPPAAGRLGAVDAVVLPPGVAAVGRPESAATAVSVEFGPACVADLVQAELGATRPPLVILVPADALPRLLVAALADYGPQVAVLGYVGAEHLHAQAGVAARLRPGRVLADPAGAAWALRRGLPARSIYAGAGGCVLVHAVERALARASLRRLGRVAHHAGPPALLETMPPARFPERAARGAAREVIALRTSRRFVLIRVASISYISSRGGLVTAYTDTGAFWSDRTLGEVASWLDPACFLRLDASRVVNLSRVVELVPWTHQRYRLRLDDAAKTELVLSRDVGRRLRAALGW